MAAIVLNAVSKARSDLDLAAQSACDAWHACGPTILAECGNAYPMQRMQRVLHATRSMQRACDRASRLNCSSASRASRVPSPARGRVLGHVPRI